MENDPVSGPTLDGDSFLASLRSDPRVFGFFDIADDDAALAQWVAETTPPQREFIVFTIHALSITYRKGRNITAARHWAGVHLRMARTLPDDYGPRQGSLGHGRDRHIADALSGVAKLEQIQGSLERAHHLLLEAERHYDAEESRRQAEGITDQPLGERILSAGSVRASLYEDLAESAVSLGLMDQARHYYDLWVQFRNEFRNSADEIGNLMREADFFIDEGKPDYALFRLQKAMDTAELETNDLRDVSRMACQVHRSTARVYASLGAPRTALKMLDKARALVDELAEPTLPAGIEIDTAHILRDFPFLGDPLPYLLRALARHSIRVGEPAGAGDRTWTSQGGKPMRVAVPDAAWPILLDAAQTLEACGRLGEAEDFLRLAVGIAGQVRDGALDQTSRMTVQEQLSQAFIDLARVQLRLADESSGAGPHDSGMFADAAWRTVEALRARSFLDTLGDIELTYPAGISDALIAHEAELLDRRRLLRLSSSRDEAFWSQMEAIGRELSALWDEMAAASAAAAEYVAVRQARPASRAEVTDLLSAEGRGRVVMVNMLFPDDAHLALLAVDAASEHARTAVSSVDRRRLTRFVTANFGEARLVRELATDLEESFHHELSGVVAPIADLCAPGDTLIICPAAPLHHVPLGAVRAGQDVLLARNPLAFAPSASVLRSRRLSRQTNAASEHAIFGDPSGDLPGARDEAIRLRGRWNVTPHLGEQATGDALLSALGATRSVHVAAHAAFDADHPLQSSVRMADREVSAREILRVRAPALDLVTLSGCESGVYHAGRSEDPLGLTRALLFAGAQSTLSNLWRVDDKWADRLMDGFYGNLDNGVPKAEALRRSALAVREESSRIDHWAAFILTGAWT